MWSRRGWRSPFAIHRAPRLFVRLNTTQSDAGYDLAVIGGGSGGIACAREAAQLGQKVICFDYVTPSPQGSTWGLGGTCVNVGCIPKKLFHHGAMLGAASQQAQVFGWRPRENSEADGVGSSHDWNTLTGNVRSYIKSLNFGYRSDMLANSIRYENARVRFKDAGTLEATNKKEEKKLVQAKKTVIAVGGRPRYLDIPGASLAITSDDIFTLPHPPGRTLVIGASYIALETAGFLTQYGYPTTVMSRSIFLRGYDQEMANMVVDHMDSLGTTFLRECRPLALEKSPSGSIHVTYQDADGQEKQEEYDTVLMAVGRVPSTDSLNLAAAGVDTTPEGKIVAHDEKTSASNIYAIGDVVAGMPELTPVAIQAGRLLARRLYGGSEKRFDHRVVPTSVFTPLEYACCGVSEEEAIQQYGEEAIEVFMTFYTPTPWTVEGKESNRCYMKLICHKHDEMRVIGAHLFGEHAGEIMQGVSIAMKAGATKETFDDTIGIHPTSAEHLTALKVTRASGLSPRTTGC